VRHCAASFVRAVREDTEQRDLLFAGTEFGIYASFDAGEHWQPLQMNLPVSSVRDMNINGSDLIIATHGRSFWCWTILPAASAAAAQTAKAYLYAPPTAVRVDNDGFWGRRCLRRAAGGQSAEWSDGRLLSERRRWKVTLQVQDAQGMCCGTFGRGEAGGQPASAADRGAVVSQAQVLETGAGEHRFVWDLSEGGSSAGLGDDDSDDAIGLPAGPRVARESTRCA